MALIIGLPSIFREAAHKFADDLRASFASSVHAQPEDQLKPPVQALIRAAKASGVITRTEAHVDGLGGRPDIGVEIDGALCGHVELKAPGHGALTKKYKGRDKAQWNKFTALPNILYTDAYEWALYRSGVQYPTEIPIVVRWDDVIEKGSSSLTDELVRQLFVLITEFLSWTPITPTGPKALAQMLAPLCRLLREDVSLAVADETSALKRLSSEMRDYLFPHSSDDDFSDIYAQTLTYALLLARLSGEDHLNAVSAAARLDSGHGLLAETLRILTQARARAEIEVPVALLERVIGAVDPAQLSKRGDPWLYFYEDFLAAYDPKRRKEYGVYYTPQEVVSCQTNLVAELLDKRFNKPLTFADEGVVFLDSSAGTAAYPLAAIEFALRRVEAEQGPGAIAEYATRCAQNVYAFEIQVGPYAVSHLRLTKLLVDAGATLPVDGLHVLLTDTLESPHVEPPIPPLMAERLTEEQRRARQVKATVPVFVSMGNPPYFLEHGNEDSANTRGKWVRFGDSTDITRHDVSPNRPIISDFVDLAPSVHVKNLYNLYVYFWRWTLWKMFEQPGAPRKGIVSFITAASYLRGPGFTGMRQRMREAFDDIWIIDLEGDNLGARKTENVFAIQTPVCIAVGIRHAEAKRHRLALVHYVRIEGSREEKLDKLKAIRSFDDVPWSDCFSGAQEPFLPQQAGNYFAWPLVTDLWPLQLSGVQWKRRWPIAETDDVLTRRWQSLVKAPLNQKSKLLRETESRTIDRIGKLFIGDNELPSIKTLDVGSHSVESIRYGWRSFDRYWCLPDTRVCDRPRPDLINLYSNKQVFMVSMLTKVLGLGPSATSTCMLPDTDYFCGRGGKDVIPLWRDAEATQANLPLLLLESLEIDLEMAVTAEDFFAYTYAVLSAPDYVITFSEELTIPGPRLPISSEAILFEQAVTLGRKLLWLHTFGERFVPNGERAGHVPNGKAKSIKPIPNTPTGYPESFEWIEYPDGSGQGVLHIGTGQIEPVSKAVFEYSVSGYEVVKGWLGSRMKKGSGKKSSPLDDIRPTEWTATLSQELRQLLWVLEATVEMQSVLNELLKKIVSGPTFNAADLPTPTDAERASPVAENDDAPQHDWINSEIALSPDVSA
ncbi:type ISP restriction/modification enzyme [Rhodoferax sp.]|uniref:type ISP restriction/modification enzyme n=1 Tax=Rhodoferax sp. TaxID=50421 RepID=UPI0025FCF324|nr:type ISP restriction/modification enzyme [Rhodoferax sp.]